MCRDSGGGPARPGWLTGQRFYTGRMFELADGGPIVTMGHAPLGQPSAARLRRSPDGTPRMEPHEPVETGGAQGDAPPVAPAARVAGRGHPAAPVPGLTDRGRRRRAAASNR